MDDADQLIHHWCEITAPMIKKLSTLKGAPETEIAYGLARAMIHMTTLKEAHQCRN